MKAKTLFSFNLIGQLRWVVGAAIVLPMAALLGLVFAWATGLPNLIDTVIVIVATIMFGLLTASWWWLICLISRMLQTNKRVIIQLRSTTEDLRGLRSEVDEVLAKMINNLK